MSQYIGIKKEKKIRVIAEIMENVQNIEHNSNDTILSKYVEMLYDECIRHIKCSEGRTCLLVK